jgi:anti-anti-sigma factor
MEITSQTQEDRYELHLKGRLDANWAEHVANAIDSAIRSGRHHIDLQFGHVTYVSSAGIRVLLKYYKQLKAVRGVLRVLNPIDSVQRVLALSGVAGVLGSAEPVPPASPSRQETRRWERNGVAFEAHPQIEGGALEGRLIGDTGKFSAGRLSVNESERTSFGIGVFGVGLGAFGNDLADADGRFGEFLAVAGTAVAQPTDGSSVPDFQTTEGQLVPEVNILYGLTGSGDFSRLLRFEAGASQTRVITLSELVEAGLEEVQASAAGFVIVAESSCLVGATLRQSPTRANGQSPWSFPGVREWLSFTTERNDERNLALIVGFAQREPQPESATFLRPIGPGTQARGHFHAAAFPYRPVPKGNLSLQETVTSLLDTQSSRAVMHLLADEREFEGVGQTDLMRGACWIGPLRSLTRATSSSTTP